MTMKFGWNKILNKVFTLKTLYSLYESGYEFVVEDGVITDVLYR